VADLLFLTQRLPYPPTKGEKIRQWRILNHLRQWYEPHVGCLVDDPADLAHLDTVRAVCRDLCAPPIDRRVASLTCARGLLTGEPLSVTFFRHRGLQAWVDRVLREVKPALTVVISSNMAPYVLHRPRTGRLIVDFVDVDSEKFLAYAESTAGPMRYVYRREWRRMAALERDIARACDLSVFVSDAEAALFRARLPERAERIVGISNGVDHRYFDPGLSYPDPVEKHAKASFVFTGTMDYKPNVLAVTWFATEILPMIRAARPGAVFFIVGANPSPEVKRLGNLDGVTVTGSVADVRPYLAHAAVAVAPLRVARGIQNKVLEAMAMAKPVIVTSGALEGIDAIPGRDVVLADDTAAFADAAIRLVATDGALTPEGAAIGQSARRLITTTYDWTTRLSGFDDLVRPDRAAGAAGPLGRLLPTETAA
jgi:sugar transferase (PEP-CTERM/EpsH1 system associated)